MKFEEHSLGVLILHNTKGLKNKGLWLCEGGCTIRQLNYHNWLQYCLEGFSQPSINFKKNYKNFGKCFTTKTLHCCVRWREGKRHLNRLVNQAHIQCRAGSILGLLKHCFKVLHCSGPFISILKIVHYSEPDRPSDIQNWYKEGYIVSQISSNG